MRLIALAGLAALLAGLGRRRRAGQVVRISRVVADLDRSERFYRDGLGFRRVWEGPLARQVAASLLPGGTATLRRMRLGAEEIDLVRWDQTGTPYPADSRSDDRWFQHIAVVCGDLPAAYARLLAVSPQPISADGPQVLPGGVAAFKFRDPDGHPVELIRSPPGQGRAVWQRSGITLGIDHSALAVGSGTRSLRFYRHLGFRKTGETFNEGPAQAALDGLEGATARVIGLRLAPSGPGLELLAYHPPGRAMPPHRADALLTDWVTLEGRMRRMRLLHDPDGHLLMLAPAPVTAGAAHPRPARRRAWTRADAAPPRTTAGSGAPA